MNKKDRKKLYELLEQWTRAEILARHGPFCSLEFADWFSVSLDKENEIRKLMYGTDNLVQLGIEWNLLKERSTRKRTYVNKLNIKKFPGT